ncbi:MAG: V-type ATP synthase subunit E [Clostridiales bacterium]|nr:V-type ATP synthase subunit E [Clostridiales bacterium]
MITLDNKMELFSKVVLEKVKKEYKEVLKNADEKNEIVRQDKLKQLEEQSLQYVKDVNESAQKDKKRILSKAISQARKNILIKREEIFIELYDMIIEELKKFRMTDEYARFIDGRVKDSIVDLLELKNDLMVICRKNDIELVRKALTDNGVINSNEFIVNEEILGGFILLDRKKGFKINLTLDSILEENKAYIGKLIFDLLEEAGDVNG